MADGIARDDVRVVARNEIARTGLANAVLRDEGITSAYGPSVGTVAAIGLACTLPSLPTACPRLRVAMGFV